MSDTYEITADSMKSVQAMIDRLTKASMDVTHMMAVIAKGPIQSAIRSDVENNKDWYTHKSPGDPASSESYNKHIDIKVRYGASRFTMIVEGNSVKGDMLITGRQGGRKVRAKRTKALPLGKSQGNIFAYRKAITMGAQKGIYKELRRIADRRSREILRYEIKRRSFVGKKDNIRAFKPGTHRIVGPERI
jgi:hypothetical protein